MSIILKLKKTRKSLDEKDGRQGGTRAASQGRGQEPGQEGFLSLSLGLTPCVMESFTEELFYLSFQKISRCLVENGMRAWRNRQKDQPRE